MPYAFATLYARPREPQRPAPCGSPTWKDPRPSQREGFTRQAEGLRLAVWRSSGERAAAAQLVLLPSCQGEPRRGAFMEGHRRLSFDGREHVGRGVGSHVQPVSAPRLTPARPRRDRSRGAGLMPKGSRPHDPMRELDLLLLEDLLMRRNCEPTASHRTLQTMCMLLLLFGRGSRICLPPHAPDPGTTAQSQFKHSSSAVSLGAPVP